MGGGIKKSGSVCEMRGVRFVGIWNGLFFTACVERQNGSTGLSIQPLEERDTTIIKTNTPVAPAYITMGIRRF